MHDVVAVFDENSGAEALYIDGEIVFHDSTVYATDIARSVREACGDKPITFRHVATTVSAWPAQLKDVPQ